MRRGTVMHFYFIFFLIIVFIILTSLTVEGNRQDPCDNFGNCLSASLTYLRSNPDGTLYPGDSFTIKPLITTGPNTINYTVYWSYDSAAFTKSGDMFTVTGNETGSFTIDITAVFTMSNNSTSTLSVSENVEVIQLNLNVNQLVMVNITNSYGYLMRNPDGSFYRNDSFCVRWSASFSYSNYRKDIWINFSSSSPLLGLLNSSSNGRFGLSCYFVRPEANYGPANLTVNFNAINWMGISIAHLVRQVPFVVVKYDPHFTYFAYMLYNSRLPSTYQRPFVVLVRYDYNLPGFSYKGDINTAPISLNDTQERAVLNNFTFTTEAWKLIVSLNSPHVSSSFNFVDAGSINAVYTQLNKSAETVFTTGFNRVQKFYFIGNLSSFSYPYYNVTISAYSDDFAGSNRTSLFNTSYLYEPVKYDGELVFHFYNQEGKPDTTANVTITAHNPSPINVYLIDVVKSKFGNDTAVLNAFSQDLYPSNYTQQLKQAVPNTNGTIVYFINQTNYAMPQSQALPWFNVIISSQKSGLSFSYSPNPPFLTNGQELSCISNCLSNISYVVYNHFGLALADSSTIPSLPFNSISAYFIMPTDDILALPLNDTVSGYYVNWVSAPPPGVGAPVLDPVDPLTQEPGGLMQEYQMIYGLPVNIDVNTGGGGIAITGRPQPLQGGSYYTISFMVYPQSGGIVHLTIVSDQGERLLDSSFGQNSGNSSFSLQGFVGPLQVTIGTAGVSSSVRAIFTNAWGAQTYINGIQVQPAPAQPLKFPWELISIVLLTLFGLYFLQLAIKKRNRSAQT
jgi:hypothetical protein